MREAEKTDRPATTGQRGKKLPKGCSVPAALAIALFILTLSIAVPILWRGFYYLHVDRLDLPGQTGLSREEILDAFHEMLDFCVKGTPFGTGVLPWSESGMEHFADCAALFRLDFIVLGISAVLTLLCLIFYQRFRTLGKHGPLFWGGLGLGSVFLIVAGLASIDFDRTFVIFHELFFPGKTNWTFDPRVDGIIRILPEVYFMDCAILIVAVMVLLCLLAVLADALARKKAR